MLTISGISIDYAKARPGVRGHITGSDTPVIGWSAFSSKAGAKQAACRMTAGGWDSGWIEKTEQRLRLPTIKRGAATRIAITIRDNFGEESAAFEDVIYNAKTDWDAEWIGDSDIESERAVYLRGKFEVSSKVRAARLYAGALGYQTVSVNGTSLGNAKLDPAFTDYSKRAQYVYYPEIEELIKPGENEICAVIGSGWRKNKAIHQNEWLPDTLYTYEGEMEFSAILEIETESGEVIRFKTGEGWEAGIGPIGYCNVFNGANYDAREDIRYSPAKLMPAPSGAIEPMVIPPVTEHGALAPLAVWPDGEDAVIMDFGQNIAGVLRVELPENLKPGQVITLTHTEELTEDGKLFPDTLRNAKVTDTYTASGDGRDLRVWQPEFTYHGFRYARIEGLTSAWDARGAKAVELHTDVDLESSFRCGNALITKIHDICAATERANIHSILTDCPQRDERLGWMNDATVRFEETPYNFDVGAIFPKIIEDMTDVQTEEGAIGCTAPFVAGSIPADPVCSSFLIAGYGALMHAGNEEIVKKAYKAWDAWEKCLIAHSDDFIVNYTNYGDWAGPVDCCVPAANGKDPGAVSAVTPGIFMSTGYSYLNCKLLEKFAAQLGDAAEAARHGATGEKVKKALLNKWYDAETGKFATGSQACQAFALYLGISPDPEKTALRLHEAVAEAGYRLTTGNLCSRYIMDALSDNGYAEDAWKLMTREEYPSIGFMIQQEATTVWERFELMKNPTMNSHCHPMYGAVDYWMYAYLAGVKPLTPGYAKFRVAPVLPEKLSSVQAIIETPLGKIEMRWTKRYDGKHLQLFVPFGAEAEIDFCGEKRSVGSGFHYVKAE